MSQYLTSLEIYKGVPLEPSGQFAIGPFGNKTKQFNFFHTYLKPTNTTIAGTTSYSLYNLSYQRWDLGHIRVPIPKEALEDCNYLCFWNNAHMLGTSTRYYYAYLDRVEYVSDLTSEIYYSIDYIQTFMFDYNLAPCFVERQHSDIDENGDIEENLLDDYNVTGEYVTNGQGFEETKQNRIVIVMKGGNFTRIISDTPTIYHGDNMPPICCSYNTQHIPIIGTSWIGNTNKAGYFTSRFIPEYAQYGGTINTGGVYVYYTDTFVDIKDEYGYIIKTAQERIDEAVEAIKDEICLTGLAQYVIAMYQVYCPYADHNTLLSPHRKPLIEFRSAYKRKVFIDQEKGDDINVYVPKNAKAYTYPYSKLHITTHSGSENDYQYEFFKDREFCRFSIWSCVYPQPAIYLIPDNYKNNDSDSGSLDLSNAVSILTFPQNAFIGDNYAEWLVQNKRALQLEQGMALVNFGTGMTTALVQGMLGSDKAVGSAVGAVSGLINKYAEINKNEFRLKDTPNELHGSTQNGSILTSFDGYRDESGLTVSGGLNGTGFYLYNKQITAKEMERIDSMWNAYGYPVRKIKTPDITNRTYWNYIQTNNCKLKNTNFPNDIEKIICGLYDKGITFWHVSNGNTPTLLTTVGEYTANNGSLTIPTVQSVSASYAPSTPTEKIVAGGRYFYNCTWTSTDIPYNIYDYGTTISHKVERIRSGDTDTDITGFISFSIVGNTLSFKVEDIASTILEVGDVLKFTFTSNYPTTATGSTYAFSSFSVSYNATVQGTVTALTATPYSPSYISPNINYQYNIHWTSANFPDSPNYFYTVITPKVELIRGGTTTYLTNYFDFNSSGGNYYFKASPSLADIVTYGDEILFTFTSRYPTTAGGDTYLSDTFTKYIEEVTIQTVSCSGPTKSKLVAGVDYDFSCSWSSIQIPTGHTYFDTAITSKVERIRTGVSDLDVTEYFIFDTSNDYKFKIDPDQVSYPFTNGDDLKFTFTAKYPTVSGGSTYASSSFTKAYTTGTMTEISITYLPETVTKLGTIRSDFMATYSSDDIPYIRENLLSVVNYTVMNITQNRDITNNTQMFYDNMSSRAYVFIINTLDAVIGDTISITLTSKYPTVEGGDVFPSDTGTFEVVSF